MTGTEPLADSIAAMGRALHAARLELPATVADDLTDRWRDLLDALDRPTMSDRTEPMTDEEWGPFAQATGIEPPICPMCNEPVVPGGDISPTSLLTPEGKQTTHRSCMLREVLGGIGHLIAHDYWCVQHHDPDAGLTRRQSALLVDVYAATVGVERTEPNTE